MIDIYGFSVLLSSNFVLLVIFVTENQPIFFHLPCNVFYIQCLSFQLHGLQKREFYQLFFPLSLIPIHCQKHI